MDLRTLDTLVPAIIARGAIVEKAQQRRKAIGDYLNNQAMPCLASLPQSAAAATQRAYFFLAGDLALTLR